jgi:hypothetical protein
MESEAILKVARTLVFLNQIIRMVNLVTKLQPSNEFSERE